VADDGIVVLTLIGALGCGLIGGIFFAFSTFVMKALSRLAPGQGIAAMQSINVVVLNPWFLGPFMGTAVICLVLIVVSLFGWREPESILRIAGGLLYLLGTFGVTAAFNVPRNDTLAAVEATSDESERAWAEYVPGWTIWNTVRTLAAVAAAALLTIALVVA
jgi:uncharacterized membrane protein